MTGMFKELTTAERDNDERQTRANEIALRSISAIPSLSSRAEAIYPGSEPAGRLIDAAQNSRSTASGVRDCFVFEGFKTSGKPPAPNHWTWGGFILAEN
jgi:hypothetical protein